jgi:hypothetical protein
VTGGAARGDRNPGRVPALIRVHGQAARAERAGRERRCCWLRFCGFLRD